jgi:hypothetical protein
MARNLKKFANPKFVKTVDLGLLRRLLERHRARLPDFDFAVFEGDPVVAREAVGALFLGPEAAVPEGLVVDIHHLSDLGTEAGLDILLAEARRHGVQLVAPNAETARQAPKHVALAAYLDHRDIFDAAADRIASQRCSTVAELVGREAGLALQLDAGALERFRVAAGEIFTADLLGDHCRINWYEDGDEVALVVAHSKPVVSAPVLENGLEITTCWRPVHQARLSYVPREGRLKLGGVGKSRRARLADAFGRALLGQDGHFSGSDAQDLYTLEPFERDWPDVRLSHHPDLMIASVRVVAVQADRVICDLFRKPDRPLWSVTIAANDVSAFARLRELRGDLDFRGGWRLGMVRLQVEFKCKRGRAPRVMVEIRPRAVALFRRNRFEGAILDLLHRNGLRHVRDASDASLAAE